MSGSGRSVPADQLEKIVGAQVGWTTFVGKWGSLVVIPVIMLLAALVYFGIFRAFGATCSFSQTFSVLCWGAIPDIVKAAAAVAIGLARTEVGFTEMSSIVQANLSFLIDPTAGGSAVLWGILAAFDLFAIWGLGLRISGMSRLPGVSKTLAIVTSVFFFLLANGLSAWNLAKMAG